MMSMTLIRKYEIVQTTNTVDRVQILSQVKALIGYSQFLKYRNFHMAEFKAKESSSPF